MSEFKIYSPTYRRSKIAKTHQLFPDLKYVVCESQADDYRAQNLPMVVVPDSAQGNVSRIRNFILDNFEKNVLIVDDDIDKFGMWVKNKRSYMTPDEIMQMVETGFQLAEDMDVKMWGINCIEDKGSYREYTPFSFSAFIGGPFQGHCNNDLRYDESLPLKEDYDLFIQVMNKHRRILRMNRFHYICKMHEIPGGCSTYRTLEREKSDFIKLQKKWGSKIVQRDSEANLVNMKKTKEYDINPKVNIPIKGI